MSKRGTLIVLGIVVVALGFVALLLWAGSMGR